MNFKCKPIEKKSGVFWRGKMSKSNFCATERGVGRTYIKSFNFIYGPSRVTSCIFGSEFGKELKKIALLRKSLPVLWNTTESFSFRFMIMRSNPKTKWPGHQNKEIKKLFSDVILYHHWSHRVVILYRMTVSNLFWN